MCFILYTIDKYIFDINDNLFVIDQLVLPNLFFISNEKKWYTEKRHTIKKFMMIH